MIEQKLKKLQNISVSNSVKNEDWEKILEKERRLSSFSWKEVSAIVAVIALAFTLFFISNRPIENQTAADPYTPIKTIYFTNMNSVVEDFEPKSTYYPFVRKFEGEVLNEINEKIKKSNWKQIEGDLEGSYVTYKFVFADGTSKVLRNYIDEPTEYLFEEDTGYAYVLQVDSFSDTVQLQVMKMLVNKEVENKPTLYLLLLLSPLVILILIRNHNYKKETGIQKLPKRRVNNQQLLVQFTIILMLIVLTVLTQNLHYGWWVIGLLGNIFIFRLLDDKSEHYKWRIMNDLLLNLIALSIATTQFYYFL